MNKNNLSFKSVIQQNGSKFWLIVSAVIMAAIFIMSSHNGEMSNGLSGKFSAFFSRILFLRFEEMSSVEQHFIVYELNFFLRKAAHFTIYALLGICLYLATMTIKIKKTARFPAAMIICAVYALTDEIHQYFVPGRDMRLTDVLIDLTGSLCGIILIIVVMLVLKTAVRRLRKLRNLR